MTNMASSLRALSVTCSLSASSERARGSTSRVTRVYILEAGDEACRSMSWALSSWSRKLRNRNASESPAILNTVALQSKLSQELSSITAGMTTSTNTSAAAHTVPPWLPQLSKIASRDRLYLKEQSRYQHAGK